MAPLAPGHDVNRTLPHKAVAHVVPLTKPRKYVGHCLRGDFSTSPRVYDDEGAAEMAVRDHVRAHQL